MGFVIEAIRNSVSFDIGIFWATSCLPKALRYRTCSLLVIATTTPGMSPLSTAAWSIRSIAAAPLAFSIGNLAEADEVGRVTNTGSNQMSATTISNRFDIASPFTSIEFGSEWPDLAFIRSPANWQKLFRAQSNYRVYFSCP